MSLRKTWVLRILKSRRFRRLAERISQLQSGFVYHYAFAMLLGSTSFVTFSRMCPLHGVCFILLKAEPSRTDSGQRWRKGPLKDLTAIHRVQQAIDISRSKALHASAF